MHLDSKYIEFKNIDFTKNIKDIKLGTGSCYIESSVITLKNFSERILSFHDERALMPFNFYKLYSLRLEDIDTQIIFKAECFNLKYVSFHNCDFTSINIDASPVTVGLFFCKYLKDFTTNLTKCEELVISTCTRLSLSSLFNGDTLSFLQLYSLTLRNIHHQI